MVNWRDPVLLLKTYYAFIKLNHAISGIYIWEFVFTSGFELDVLRRKRPYRWTIWLYLGTRYTGLLAFIFFFIVTDDPRVSCHPFMVATFTLGYASWTLASSIMALRVIAIWNRNIIVSLIAVCVLAGGLALNIWDVTLVGGTYNPIVDTCIVLHTRVGHINATGVLVVDVVLLLSMLIGLLRHAHRDSIGICKLLYQQCIIWLALAFLAEIPPVVFLWLDLNDAWNQMFIGTSIAILSIGACRLYRSLSDRGSLTEYESSDLLEFSSGALEPAAQRRGANVYGSLRFASVTLSEGTRTTQEAQVFPPADQIQVEFTPGGSTPSLAHKNTKNGADRPGYERV